MQQKQKSVKMQKITQKSHISNKKINKNCFSYESIMEKCDEETRNHYEKYITENWEVTHPIMKDVSSFEKIRPKDGVEFCILY